MIENGMDILPSELRARLLWLQPRSETVIGPDEVDQCGPNPGPRAACGPRPL